MHFHYTHPHNYQLGIRLVGWCSWGMTLEKKTRDQQGEGGKPESKLMTFMSWWEEQEG